MSDYIELVDDPNMDFDCVTTTPLGTEFWITRGNGCPNEHFFALAPFEEVIVKLKVRYKTNLPSSRQTLDLKAYSGTDPSTQISHLLYLYPYKRVSGGFFDGINISGQLWPFENPVLVSGTLTMTNATPFAFSGINGANKKLLFTDRGELRIRGAKVTLMDVELESCTAMWEGIKVEANRELELNMTKISDAQFGVSVQKSGKATILSSTFINCNFGIQNDTNNGTGNNWNITALGNSFISQGTGLKPAYGSSQTPVPGQVGYAGIFLRDMKSGFNIGASAMETNEFSNLQFGVVAINTPVTINDAEFRNMAYGVKPAGYTGPGTTGAGIYALGGLLNVKTNVQFDNTHIGVHSEKNNLIVDGVDMNNVTKGIVGNRLRSYQLRQNTINTLAEGITITMPEGLSGSSGIEYNTIGSSAPQGAAYSGIRVGDTEFLPYHKTTVRSNKVNLPGAFCGICAGNATRTTLVANQVNVGSSFLGNIFLGGGDLNLVSCNSVSGAAGTGINGLLSGATDFTCNTIADANNGLVINGVSIGSKAAIDLTGNVYENNGAAGLRLGSDAIVGTQVHRGNRWRSGSGITSAIHEGGGNIPSMSKFTVDGMEDAEFLPSLNTPVDWFNNIPDGAITSVCNTTFACPAYPIETDPPGPESGALDTAIISDQLDGLAHPAYGKWLARRRLYTRLTEGENPYGTNQSFVNFLNTAQNGSVGAFEHVHNNIRQAFHVAPTQLALMDTLQVRVTEGLEELFEVETQLHAFGVSAADSVQWETEHGVIKGNLEQDFTTLDSIQKSSATARKAALAPVLSENGSLPDTISFEYCEKIVTGLYLQMCIADSSAFTASEVALLDSIAHLCPLSEGEAVLRARSILSATDTIVRHYDDSTACSAGIPRNQPGNPGILTQNEFVTAYPNPADNTLTVEYSTHPSGTAQLSLFNSLGQTVMTKTLPGGRGKESFAVGNLPDGIYYILLNRHTPLKVILKH